MSDDAPPAPPPVPPATEPKKVRGKPFSPGNRMNPGGRPKKDARLRELLLMGAHDAARCQIAMLKDPQVSASVKADICSDLLDRGFGKPATVLAGDASSPLFPGAGVSPDSPVQKLLATIAARNAAAVSETQDTIPATNVDPGGSGAATRAPGEQPS